MTAVPPFSEAGVFFVTDKWLSGNGMIPDDNSFTTAQQNAQVLQAIIDLAQSYTSAGACPTAPPFWAATIVFPGHVEVPPPVGPSGGPASNDGAQYFIAQPPSSPQNTNGIIDVGCNWPLKFVGTGSIQLVAMANENGVLPDMFYVHTNIGQDKDIGGVTFEDLQFSFATNAVGKAAIHVAAATASGTNDGAQNVRINRCVFTDCPIGVWFEQCLQNSMFQCSGRFVSFNGTAIKIGGPNNGFKSPLPKDVFITDCSFQVDAGGPTPNIAMDIISAEHVRVSSTRFDNFDQGIQIRPGYAGPDTPASGFNVVRCFFNDLTMYTGATQSGGTIVGTALTIQPQSSGQAVGQISFESCLFEPGDDSTFTRTQGAGITLDSNGSVIDTVRFVSCYASRWSGPGLQIGVSAHTGTVQNIEVLGGMYSGNNKGQLGILPFGIAVFSPAQRVRIVGTSCTGIYQYITHDNSVMVPDRQLGGIYVYGASDVIVSACDLTDNENVGLNVSGGASRVLIDGCDATGNGTYGVEIDGTSVAVSGICIRNCLATGYSGYNNAVHIAGPVTNLTAVEVTNCAGYNDQGVVPTLLLGPTSVVIDSASTAYWGPMEFYAANGSASITSITMDGHNTFQKSGSFLVVPGESAQVTWTGTGVDLLVIGK